jgi:hypothetical protein
MPPIRAQQEWGSFGGFRRDAIIEVKTDGSEAAHSA